MASDRVMPQDRLADIERATDKLCKSTPLSVMCQYPGRASMEVFQSVSAEPGAGLRERLLQAAPIEGGIDVAGELDISNKARRPCPVCRRPSRTSTGSSASSASIAKQGFLTEAHI